MPTIVFDLETIVDPELPLPDLPEGGFPPPVFHKIVVFGAMWLDDAFVPGRLGILGEERPENEALEDFVRLVGDKRPLLVTYNGRGFDLPVIAARCFRHGITFRQYYAQRDMRYRFSADGHLDVMDFLSDFGAARATKLDIMAKAMGLPGKVGIDGKDVGPMVHAGRIAEVRAYCLCDVVQTTGVFLRTQLLRGELELDGYRAAMRKLIEIMRSDERLAPVAAGLDERRLLLDDGA